MVTQPKILISVTIFAFILFAILPLILILYNAFSEQGLQSLSIIGGLLSDKRQLLLLYNSLSIAFGAALLATMIGVPIGIILSRIDIPLRRFLLIATLTPLIIPPYISALNWTNLLGANGIINKGLDALFPGFLPQFSIYGIGGAIFILGFSYYPFVALLTLSGMASINRRLEEASLLNRSLFNTIIGISMPLIFPFVMAGFLFTFILSITDYGVPSLLRVNVYPIEIFIQFSAYFQEHKAIILSLPILAITIGLIFLLRFFMGRRSYVEFSSHHKYVTIHSPGRWKYLFVAFVFLVIFISPLSQIIGLLIRTGSIDAVSAAINTAHSQIIRTVILAISGATLATGLGFIIAYFIERSKTLGSAILDLLTLMPFGFPGIIMGIGLIETWNRPILANVYGTFPIVIIGYIAVTISFTIRIISAGIKQINVELEEAALLTSQGWWKRISQIVIPLLRPSLSAAWIASFLLCMYELGMTLLIVPPGESTLSIRIYTLLHYGAGQIVSALALILIFVTILPIMAILLLHKYTRSGSHAA